MTARYAAWLAMLAARDATLVELAALAALGVAAWWVARFYPPLIRRITRGGMLFTGVAIYVSLMALVVVGWVGGAVAAR